MTRNVDAKALTNYFYIQGAGASGPSGTLEGDSGTNLFDFFPTPADTARRSWATSRVAEQAR